MCRITDLLITLPLHTNSLIYRQVYTFIISSISPGNTFSRALISLIWLEPVISLVNGRNSEVLCSVLADVIQSFCFILETRRNVPNIRPISSMSEKKTFSPQKHLAEKRKFWLLTKRTYCLTIVTPENKTAYTWTDHVKRGSSCDM